MDSLVGIHGFGFLGLNSWVWIPGLDSRDWIPWFWFMGLHISFLSLPYLQSVCINNRKWVQIPGFGFLGLDSCVWIPAFGFLGLDSWVGIPGFGVLGLDSWDWIPGFGILDLESWTWIPGFGFLA